MSEKRPKKAPKSPKICGMCTNTPKPSTGRILGYVSQIRTPRAPSPPATPDFLWFPSLRIAPYHWSLGGGGGQPGPRTAGANGGSTRVPRAKKIGFFKVVPRPLGMLKQVFLARFEPVVTRFGPWKIPKCLENGPLWDQKWVKNGSKTHFSKSDPGPYAMLKQVFLAHFEPQITCFGPWKTPNCLENGSFWVRKWVQNGSKMCFSKSDPAPLGVLKQVFLAPFKPMGTGFGPGEIPICLEKGPFWEQKWVKNGSKTCFSKTDPRPLGVHKQVF